MKKKIFKPAVESHRDWEAIENRLIALFRREIYLPILAEMELSVKQSHETLEKVPVGERLHNALKDIEIRQYNASDDIEALIKAISSGRLRYDKGRFKGSFSAATSRELQRLGAKWDRTERVWKIPLSKLPQEIKTTLAQSDAAFKETMKRVDAKLASLSPEVIAEKLKTENLFDDTIFRTNKKFEEQIKGITVAPQLSRTERAKIAKDYSENMKLYVKDFTEEHITDLRKKIEKSAFAGARHESMVQTIQKSYGVSASKAKFLARQETSILMSNFHEARFREAGSEEYVWKCVPNGPHGPHPVRHLHWIHDGETFRWDNPPIVDSKGNRKNPGIDYNCRCTALPVLKLN